MSKNVHCPVCGGEASIKENSRNATSYDCPECGVFKVAASMEAQLNNMSKSSKQATLGRAKSWAKPGQLPYIYE